MLVHYGIGAVLGAICGGIAAFLAYSGYGRRRLRLFARLFRGVGRVRRRCFEALGAGVLLGLYGTWLCDGEEQMLAGFLLTVSCLVSVTLTDLRRREIRMDTLACYAAALVIYRAAVGGLYAALLGAAAGAALLGAPHLLKKESVGLGDVALLAVCGLYYGASGVLSLLLRALVLMAAVGIVQLLRRRATGKSEIPMTPFLLVSALLF